MRLSKKATSVQTNRTTVGLSCIVFFTDCEWSLGLVHGSLRRCFEKNGWQASLCEWSDFNGHPQHLRLDPKPVYMTLPGTPAQALLHYGISPKKTFLVAHAESDLLAHLQLRLNFDEYAAYGVTSDVLACSSIALGITRVPEVLRLGLDCSKYKSLPLPTSVQSIGYLTAFERRTLSGVEIKRGKLAEQCAREAGLEFKTFERVSNKVVHELYGEFDAYVLSSLQDASPHPPLEAAAAGRLLIGSPVGHYTRLVVEGLGVLAPLGDHDFKDFVVSRLKAWKRLNRSELSEQCGQARAACVRSRDWSVVFSDWFHFVAGDA